MQEHSNQNVKQEISHIDLHDDIIYVNNKSSKDDIIEYNPEELSLEDSEVDSGNLSYFIDLFVI